MRARPLLTAGLVAGLLLGAPGCGDDDDEEAAASPLADAAVYVCGRLRDEHNALADLANDAVAGISAQEPATRRATLLEAFDAAIERARAFAGEVRAWDVPELAATTPLLRDVQDGADAAIVELQDERAAFEEEVDVVSDGDVQGRVGQFFNSIEKALSVVEPPLAEYGDEELAEAFLDEPACRHVTQQYRLDDDGGG